MTPFRLIHRRRRIILLGVSLSILTVLLLVLSRLYSAARANDQIYTLENAPEYPVTIVFGAGVQDGDPSPLLADRVRMAAKLYKAGKVKAILLTGDNHITTYNEPEAMRQYALRLGVPNSALVLDYAGFRTYDSCYRARDIFKVDRAILVTQAFHLDRALLTCNGLGIDSVGVAVDVVRPEGYARSDVFLNEVREFPSTAFAVVDIIIGRKPTFLGDPLPIFVNR